MVYFSFDSAKVSKEEKEALMQFIQVKDKLAVRTHTDERGSDEYNEDLARRRAMSVISLMEEKTESMEILGEKELISDINQNNRRVEVIKKCK